MGLSSECDRKNSARKRHPLVRIKMCPVRAILTDIIDACEHELEASQVHTAGFEATPASLGERTERAARNVLKVHADLGDHIGGCSKCAPVDQVADTDQRRNLIVRRSE